MTTLPDGVPLSRLAGILHAAMVMGGRSWSGEGPVDRVEGADQPPSILSRDLLDLFTSLRACGAEFLLVGGVALLKYVDGRNTDDVDLIVAAGIENRISELVIEARTPDTPRGRFRSLRIDLHWLAHPVFRLVRDQHATVHAFAEIPVPCATVAGLVLLKLYALPALYEQGALQRAALYEGDITMLCERHRPELEPILQALKPHLASGQLDELRRITDEIIERLSRMRRSGGGTG
jgi:hypothetical protein